MKAKYGVGDIVATNDLYLKEGRKYFGKKLMYANFKRKILRVIENTYDEKDGQGDVWDNVYVFSDDVQLCERFLKLVTKAPDIEYSKCLDLNGKRIDVNAFVAYINAINPRGNIVTAYDKTDYYVFYATSLSLRLDADRRNKSTGLREYMSHVCVTLQEALKIFISDVKENKVVLDDIDGIIWSIKDNLAEKSGFYVTAKYSFKEEYLPPRCSKPRLRDVAGSVDIKIKSLSADDAPIAMEVTTAKCISGDMVWVDVPYRWYKGNLYTPVFAIDGSYLYDRSAMLHMLFRINLISNDVSTHKEMIKQLKERASIFLLVDSALFVKSGEPRYHYDTFGMRNNHGGTGFFIATHYNDNLSLDSYFNAFQREEAIAAFKRVALKRGDTESVKQEPKENIKVFIPEAVKLKPNSLKGINVSEAQKIIATHRLLDQQGRLLGLVLYDGKSKNDTPLAKCIKLADSGDIRNIKAVHRKDGKSFLQGKGISLEALPCKTIRNS